MLELLNKVRIDEGFSQKKAVATEEVLSDKTTASHYQVGQKDALGNIIELGKEFTYNDFLAKKVFKLYTKQTRIVKKVPDGHANENPLTVPLIEEEQEFWFFDSEYKTLEEALTKANDFLQ